MVLSKLNQYSKINCWQSNRKSKNSNIHIVHLAVSELHEATRNLIHHQHFHFNLYVKNKTMCHKCPLQRCGCHSQRSALQVMYCHFCSLTNAMSAIIPNLADYHRIIIYRVSSSSSRPLLGLVGRDSFSRMSSTCFALSSGSSGIDGGKLSASELSTQPGKEACVLIVGPPLLRYTRLEKSVVERVLGPPAASWD